MMKKCDANCDARRGADQSFNGYHLWLRNNIFYYRVELPRENNKRRYKRISLHTNNFYEAREIIRNMTTDNKTILDRIRTLYNNLDFVLDLGSNWGVNGNYGVVPQYRLNKKLSNRNKREDIEELHRLSTIAENSNQMTLSQEDRELLKAVVNMRPLLENFLKQNTSPTPHVSMPMRKISEVLETMLIKGNNCKSEQVRKRNTLTTLLSAVELKLDDDYALFHNVNTINKLGKYVVSEPNVKGDKKRRQIRYIKELATCGSNIDPDHYKSNIILNLPNIEKTKKSEKNPHLPYSKEQLLEIFNPKHTYFQHHPDAFFVCLIALYTGSRANAAITLQYNDVFEKDGIPCIYFRENHPIKQLKNDASERIVPIHSELINVGFVDYVRNRQKRLNAKGTDFIFPRCQTKSGEYNNKYTVRVILKYFKEIGVKSDSNDRYDFHSFRKNASIAMQDARIIRSYILDIIGWEGNSTMEQSYSNHTLAQIKAELEKFNYDFLSGHFAKWKEIMKKAK